MGELFTSFEEIADARGRCSPAYNVGVHTEPFPIRGYVIDSLPLALCGTYIECGDEECGLNLEFCCTETTAGGEIKSCRRINEVLPARNGIVVDIGQRTCTIP